MRLEQWGVARSQGPCVPVECGSQGIKACWKQSELVVKQLQ